MLNYFLFLRFLLGHLHLLNRLLGDQWNTFYWERLRVALNELLAEPNENALPARVDAIYRCFEGTPAESLVHSYFELAREQAQKIDLGDQSLIIKDPATGDPFAPPYGGIVVSAKDSKVAVGAKDFNEAASELDEAIFFVGRHGVGAAPPEQRLEDKLFLDQEVSRKAPQEATTRQKSGPRFVNVSITHGSNHALVLKSRSLRPNNKYALRVNIGAWSPESAVKNPVPVPSEKLPASQEGHWLEVIVVSDDFRLEQRRYDLFLPTVGASFLCKCKPGGPHTCIVTDRQTHLFIPIVAPSFGYLAVKESGSSWTKAAAAPPCSATSSASPRYLLPKESGAITSPQC